MRPRILHLTGDFPDPVNERKTPVIRRLIELTADSFEHQVISINRQSPGFANITRAVGTAIGFNPIAMDTQTFESGLAVKYLAPGKGILHKRYLSSLGNWLADWVRENDAPALIIAHKLTIEGIPAFIATRELGIPYAITLQGNTDLKILQARPDLRPLFSEIWRGCSAAFSFAPWTLDAINAYLGQPGGSSSIIPCPLGKNFDPIMPNPSGRHLLSAFHLNNYRDKNFAGLTHAMRLLQAKMPDLKLAVAGSGSTAAQRSCQRIAKPIKPALTFLGHLRGEALRQRMNESAAFVLPSKRESFGLVFIEALFSGLPIIYPAGASVDGLFDRHKFAIRVDAQSPRSIADAMEHAVLHQAELKQELRNWLGSTDIQRFTREVIARDFAKGIVAGITGGVTAQSARATN